MRIMFKICPQRCIDVTVTPALIIQNHCLHRTDVRKSVRWEQLKEGEASGA